MIREVSAFASREMALIKAKLAQLEKQAAAAAAAAAATSEKSERSAKEAAAEVAAARESAKMDAARVGSGVDALRMHVISVKRRTDSGKNGIETTNPNKRKCCKQFFDCN